MDGKVESSQPVSGGILASIGIIEGVVIADTVGLVLLGAWSLSNFRDQRDQIKELSARCDKAATRCDKIEARLVSLKKIDTVTRENVSMIKGHGTRISQLEMAIEALDDNSQEPPPTVEPPRRMTLMERATRTVVRGPPTRVVVKPSPSSGSESDHALSDGENSGDIFD